MLDKNINLEGKSVLITGAAGFIGSNLVLELLKKNRFYKYFRNR